MQQVIFAQSGMVMSEDGKAIELIPFNSVRSLFSSFRMYGLEACMTAHPEICLGSYDESLNVEKGSILSVI